jgi:CBS domain-containing protein
MKTKIGGIKHDIFGNYALRPVGLIIDRDLVIGSVASRASFDSPVSEAMNPEFVCIREDQDINEAAKLMKERRLSRIKGEILSKIKH